MSFLKKFCPGCCGEPDKKPVFIIGSNENTKWFLEQFGVILTQESYQEYSVMIGADCVIFSTICDTVEDTNVEEIHAQTCTAIVVLSTTDTSVTFRKPVF